MDASAFFSARGKDRGRVEPAAVSASGSEAVDLGRALRIFPQTGLQRSLTSLAILLSIGLLIAAFGDAVRDIDYRQTVHALRHLPLSAILFSIAATALSFAALVARDASALRYVGARVSTSALLIAGFCGSALGNAIGFGALSAAAVRYRIYGAAGVKSDDVSRLLVFIVTGFAIGLTGVGGFAGLVEAEPVGALLGWPPALIRAASGFALAGVACLLALGAPRPVRLGRRHPSRAQPKPPCDPVGADVDPPGRGRGGALDAPPAYADRLLHLRRHLFRGDGARGGHAYTGRSRHFRSRRALGVSRSRLLRRRRGGAGRLSLHLLPAAAGSFGHRLRLFRGRRRDRRSTGHGRREARARGRAAVADVHERHGVRHRRRCCWCRAPRRPSAAGSPNCRRTCRSGRSRAPTFSAV